MSPTLVSRAMAVTCACFVSITVTNAMFGPQMAAVSVLLNSIVGIILLGSALVIRRADLPAAAPPWIAAGCAVVMVVAGQIQVWLKPDAASFVYIMLIMVAYGPLTLGWLPSIIAAVPMFAGCVIVSRQWPPVDATDWVIASLAALAIGMTLLWIRLRSINELGDLSDLVKELATKDQLTGLLNRRGIEDRIPELAATALRHKESVFALFVDVDGLKAANDDHGHLFGDEVITVVAEAVRAVARSADLVGRWGGDEFIVLGLGLAPSPDTFTQRVLEEIHRSGIDPAEWPGGVSIGAASVSQHQIDVNDLINQADHDMYTRRRARRGN